VRRTPGPITVVVLAAVITLCSSVLTAPVTSARASSSGGTVPLVSDPSALVNPLAGTGTAPVASGNPGNVGEFPGADVPFGMVQWSPDTTPDRVEGSGYAYADSRISGFSLTHMSGTGCASYGDIPVLPTVGPIGTHPADASALFSHGGEHASPGRYQVALGQPKVTTQLTVTTRTGLARFTFPSTSQANVLLKVAGSANPVTRSSFRTVGRDQISGQVTSGQFCSTGTAYTLYFTARFNRPFASVGAWSGSAVTPGVRHCAGTTCGAFASFDARTDRAVEMKVGISFVSAANATQNLHTEDPGWSVPNVESAARQRWNALLGGVRIGGGSRAAQHTFYTALYHSLLHPNVASDDNGQYLGADRRVHRTKRVEYANFSEWDIYRSEIQLLALVAPHQTGDMVQSLVNDADAGGWLPKWEIVGGDASQMNGDSADPIIAAAYALGVRGFDARAALKKMVKGATQTETGHGLEIERQYLSQYLAQHYVNAGSLDLTSIDYSIGGSVTLEYAIDDFSIAQLAQSLGDASTYRTMMQRAHNWEYLFNPASGFIQARNPDGSFPPGPAFQSSLFEDGGQVGFEEGNPIQYTWSVPQDLDALGSLMGGDAKVVATLNTFFTHLNAGRYQPYDWAGNEPSLWTPWEYDSFGAPSRTQDVVRRIATTLYSDRPDDEPGNDDLGALSSWYVWATIGLYNVAPGTGFLALSSPLFPRVVITLPDGHILHLDAPRASTANRYIHSVRLTGARLPVPDTTCAGGASTTSVSGRWTRPWVPVSLLIMGGTLTFGLSATADTSWGSAPGAGPPSSATGRLPALGFSMPSGALTLSVGTPTTLQLGVKAVAAGLPPVHWSAAATGGLTLSATNGTIASGPSASTGAASLHCSVPAPVTQSITVEAPTAGSFTLTVHMESGTVSLPPVVLDVVAS
jgi:predicted alpha-1,2-mannosidase